MKINYLGLHGKTCWILFKDHFTGLVVRKCLVSKATPLNFIWDFLQKHFPGDGNGLDQYIDIWIKVANSTGILKYVLSSVIVVSRSIPPVPMVVIKMIQ